MEEQAGSLATRVSQAVAEVAAALLRMSEQAFYVVKVAIFLSVTGVALIYAWRTAAPEHTHGLRDAIAYLLLSFVVALLGNLLYKAWPTLMKRIRRRT